MLRWIADSLGVRAEVVYLPIDYEEQRRRITDRYKTEPDQFQMSDAELQQWQVQLQAPDREALEAGQIPAVPPGHATWRGGIRALAILAESVSPADLRIAA